MIFDIVGLVLLFFDVVCYVDVLCLFGIDLLISYNGILKENNIFLGMLFGNNFV